MPTTNDTNEPDQEPDAQTTNEDGPLDDAIDSFLETMASSATGGFEPTQVGDSIFVPVIVQQPDGGPMATYINYEVIESNMEDTDPGGSGGLTIGD